LGLRTRKIAACDLKRGGAAASFQATRPEPGLDFFKDGKAKVFDDLDDILDDIK
jgi:hypothetical protein